MLVDLNMKYMYEVTGMAYIVCGEGCSASVLKVPGELARMVLLEARSSPYNHILTLTTEQITLVHRGPVSCLEYLYMSFVVKTWHGCVSAKLHD